MKTFYIITALFVALPLIAEKTSWTPVSAEEQEIRDISLAIAQINEYFAGLGARRSSAREGAIFSYLKNRGTPAAFKVLKQLVQSGDLPKNFLTIA